MEQLLYHGSSAVIEKPVFGAGNPHNDYGLAFYCTREREMAMEWAVTGCTDGYANTYRFEDSGLAVLDLCSEGLTALHWLTVLLKHREFDLRSPLAVRARAYLFENFSLSMEGVDVVVGYRADDCYFSFAQDFLTGGISYQQLCRAMHLGRLGKQVALRSRRAQERLVFLEALDVPASRWLARRVQRDKEARSNYFDLQRNAFREDDLFIGEIVTKRMGPGDVGV